VLEVAADVPVVVMELASTRMLRLAIVSDEKTKKPLPLLFMSQFRTVMFSPNST
jgi:hypothetical protein